MSFLCVIQSLSDFISNLSRQVYTRISNLHKKMANLHNNIQLMQEFLKAPFLVLHFSYNTLMTFLMMVSVILLSMLMILLCSKSDLASDLWQQLELASKLESDLWDTADWARSGLLISMLEKLNWFRLTDLITLVLLMWKWMALFLRENHLLRCWGWPSLLNWIGVLTLFLVPWLYRIRFYPIFWYKKTPKHLLCKNTFFLVQCLTGLFNSFQNPWSNFLVML